MHRNTLKKNVHFTSGVAQLLTTSWSSRLRPNSQLTQCDRCTMLSSPTDSECRPLDYRCLLIHVKVLGTNKLSTLHFSPPWPNSLYCTNVVSFSFSTSLLQIFRLHNDHSAIYINIHTHTTHSISY